MTTDNLEIDPSMPKSKEELLELIYRDWSSLLAFIEKTSETQMIYSNQGEWSIKDNLAHLATWENFLLLHHLQGLPPAEVLKIGWEKLRQLNEDQINAIIWDRHKDQSLTDIIDEMKDMHAQVIAALEEMDFEELKKTDKIESLITRPILESVVCNTYEHYQEHLMTMYRMVEVEGKA
jgi:hypothetical protein